MFYENRQQTGNRRTVCLTEWGMFNLGTAHLWGSCSVLTPPPGIQTRGSEGSHTAANKLDVNRPQHDERGGLPCWLSGKNLSANAGTQVRSLVQEDSTHHKATKPVCYNY